MSKPPKLYHGTCATNAQSLIAHGWSGVSPVGANQGQSRYLYVTTDPEDARWYANEKGCDSILVLTDLNWSDLITDPEDGMYPGESAEKEVQRSKKINLPAKLAVTRPLDRSHFHMLGSNKKMNTPSKSWIEAYVKAAALNTFAARKGAPVKAQQRFYTAYMKKRAEGESKWPHINFDEGLEAAIETYLRAHPMIGPGQLW